MAGTDRESALLVIRPGVPRSDLRGRAETRARPDRARSRSLSRFTGTLALGRYTCNAVSPRWGGGPPDGPNSIRSTVALSLR
jgi:hypothetical protein